MNNTHTHTHAPTGLQAHALTIYTICTTRSMHTNPDNQVTPDGQRTMRTSLGAALGLNSAEALPAAWWHDAAVLHCEGYTLYKAGMAEAAMRTAKQHGLQVSLDLASFELVHNCGDALARVLREGLVDVVFCNEEEACAVLQLPQLGGANGRHVEDDPDGKVRDVDERHHAGCMCGHQVRHAQDVLLQHCQVVVVSRGAKGCSARNRSGEVGISPACIVQVWFNMLLCATVSLT